MKAEGIKFNSTEAEKSITNDEAGSGVHCIWVLDYGFWIHNILKISKSSAIQQPIQYCHRVDVIVIVFNPVSA